MQKISILIKASIKAFILGVTVDSLSLAAFAAETNVQAEKNLGLAADIQKIQNKDAHHYTLTELLKAADSNYSLQAKALASLQSKKQLFASKLAFLPSLNVDYAYQNNHMGSGSTYLNYNTQAADAKFTWNLFNGFATLNAIREKNADYFASMADEEYTRQNIYLQVVQEYYGYFDNVSSLISLQEKLKQIQSDLSRVQKLYNQGLTTIDNLESLRAQAAQSEYNIEDTKLSLEQNRLMLQYLTNIKVEALVYDRLQTPSLELKERSDIASLQYQIQSQTYQIKQLHYYPTVDVSNTFTYSIQKRPLNNMSAMGSFATIFNPTVQNIAAVTVTWKIVDTISTTVQRQYTRVAQLASEKQLQYKKLEQKKDEELYRKTLEIAKRKIESARASLKSADIAFVSIKKKYDANLINFTDYLQALSTKFDAEATFNQSLNNYELQKANYIFYSGQKIKDYL